jgi:hypothetical protein
MAQAASIKKARTPIWTLSVVKKHLLVTLHSMTVHLSPRGTLSCIHLSATERQACHPSVK